MDLPVKYIADPMNWCAISIILNSLAERSLFGTLPHGDGFPLVGGPARAVVHIWILFRNLLMMIQFHGSSNRSFHALHTKFVLVTIFPKFCNTLSELIILSYSYLQPSMITPNWSLKHFNAVVIPDICHESREYSRVNFFLAGVKFYRFNAKNWQFTVYFAVITQKIGNFLCILS